MDCTDIKNKLAARDKEVADKKAKSVEYFNLIKDDVLERLIDNHIKDDFKSDFYCVCEGVVMRMLYKKLKHNTDLMSWSFCNLSLYYSDWERNRFNVIDATFVGIGNKEFSDEYIKSINVCEKINNSFDFPYFGKLLMDYIKSKGFKQKVIENRHRKMIHRSEFKISRHALENQCCENKGEINFMKKDDFNQDSEIVNPFNVMITVFIVIAVAIVFFNL